MSPWIPWKPRRHTLQGLCRRGLLRENLDIARAVHKPGRRLPPLPSSATKCADRNEPVLTGYLEISPLRSPKEWILPREGWYIVEQFGSSVQVLKPRPNWHSGISQETKLLHREYTYTFGLLFCLCLRCYSTKTVSLNFRSCELASNEFILQPPL